MASDGDLRDCGGNRPPSKAIFYLYGISDGVRSLQEMGDRPFQKKSSLPLYGGRARPFHCLAVLGNRVSGRDSGKYLAPERIRDPLPAGILPLDLCRADRKAHFWLLGSFAIRARADAETQRKIALSVSLVVSRNACLPCGLCNRECDP